VKTAFFEFHDQRALHGSAAVRDREGMA
jgi:hypothetical protein